MFEEKLEQYRGNISKIKLLEIESARLEQEYRDIGDEICEVSSSSISEESKSMTNKISSKVESICIQREKVKKKQYEIINRLNEISEEQFNYQCEIDTVDAYLESLTMEEKFVVRMYYIEGLKNWSLIVEQYKKEFGQYISDRSLQRKKQSAIKKIEVA